MLLRTSRKIRVFPMSLGRSRPIGKQRLKLWYVLARILEEGIEVVQHRAQCGEHRYGQFSHLLDVGQTGLGGLGQWSKVRKQCIEWRREGLDGLQQRRQFFLERTYRVVQRNGIGREGVEAAQRRLRVALECGQQTPGFGERLAGSGKRVDGALSV